MKLPQLSLRDLFWLALMVSLMVGWWLHARSMAADKAHLGRVYLDLWNDWVEAKTAMENSGFQISEDHPLKLESVAESKGEQP